MVMVHILAVLLTTLSFLLSDAWILLSTHFFFTSALLPVLTSWVLTISGLDINLLTCQLSSQVSLYYCKLCKLYIFTSNTTSAMSLTVPPQCEGISQKHRGVTSPGFIS
jgi:hypothetical protein